MQTHALRLVFFLLAYFLACHAALVNRTIDSNLGDPLTGFKPTYQAPTPVWGDQTCAAWNPQTSTGCTIQPDKALAFDGTWKATTYFPTYKNINFTLNFVGISIWVYFILANLNEAGDPYTNTNVNFTLDGRSAGNFSHEPDNSTYSLMYNQTVFSRTDLTNEAHSLVVSVNDYNRYTFVCFDWAMYTADVADTNSTASGTSSSLLSSSLPTSSTSAASSSSTNSQQHTGAIVGSVIGGLALIGLIVVGLLWRRKRESRREQKDEFHSSPTPFLNTSRPSHDLTLPTTEATGSSVVYAAGRSREALSSTHRRDFSGGTSKREVNNQPISSTQTVDSVGAPPQVTADISSLSGQMQELRSQMEQLQNRRQSVGAPPAYS